MTQNPTLWFDEGQRRIDAYEFTLDDFTVPGLARQFAKINRFAGAGAEMRCVSDAQHQMHLSLLVPSHLAKAALIHEIPELFIGDVPSPIKRICPALQEIENRIQRRSAEVFGIRFDDFAELHPYDKAVAFDEARYLFPKARDIPDGLDFGVEVMSMAMAADAWMARFYQLFGKGDELKW